MLALKGLKKLINFYSPWDHQKTIGFLMIPGGKEVNRFAQIRLILEAKFGDKNLGFRNKLSPDA